MSSDPRIGTTVHSYRIEGLIGRGGMGVVYLAEHVHLEKKVALKVLAPELAHDEGFRKRFKQESQIAAKLFHPNVIPVHDAGEINGDLYIAMEYIEGTDLAELLTNEGGLAPDRALRILEQVAAALDAAHKRGLVHRDVKPANILLTTEAEGDHVFLTDFGLTKRTAAKTELTKTGYFMGTLNYVAPEQIEGRPVDGRTDQYALGCVLYECLTGTPPFARDDERATLWAQLSEPPPALSTARPELPAGLDGVISRAMAKQQEERYTDCTSFTEAVRGALGKEERLRTVAEAPAPTITAPPPGGGPPVTEYAPTPPRASEATTGAPEAPSIPAARPAQPRRKRFALIGGGAAVAAIAVVLFVILPGGDQQPTDQQSGGFEIVFLDTFAIGSECKWEERAGGPVEQGCLRSAYFFRINEGSGEQGVAIEGTGTLALTNVRAEATVRQFEGSAGSLGLSCFARPTNIAYYLLIEPETREWTIQKAPPGSVRAVNLRFGSDAAIHSGNEPNLVGIECLRNEADGTVRLTLTVNGKQLGRVTDTESPLDPGAVGMAMTGDAGVEVHFSRFEVLAPTGTQ